MKFISFSIDGEPCYGATTGSTITNLTNKVLGAKTLKELISREGISEAKKYASKNPGNINYSEIEFLPLIPDPGKIRVPLEILCKKNKIKGSILLATEGINGTISGKVTNINLIMQYII